MLVAFDDRIVNVYMGPSAQKHTIDDFNADNFDHSGLGFIRGSQISIGPAALGGRPDRRDHHDPAARRAALGRGLSRLLREVLRAPRGDGGPDREPALRRPDDRSRSQCARPWGLPAPRMTYDWRRPNELARIEFMTGKMEEIGRAMGAPSVARADGRLAGRPPPGRHAHGQRPEDFGGEPL